MREPHQQWPEDTAAVPVRNPSELHTRNNNGGDHTFDKTAPRLLYGDTSRFGMVKRSIAARKASAASAAAFASKSSRPLIQSNERLMMGVPNVVVAADTVEASTETAPPQHHHRAKLPERNPTAVHDSCQEDDQQNALLGPMGSFMELPKVSSAADLIRTASHDRSSHSVSQARGLRRANVPAAYSEIARTGYFRPSDRIGRLYTSTAVALTSTSAQSVAKAAAALAVAGKAPAGSGSSGGAGGGSSIARSVMGGGKVVTAPFAAESREILQTLALQPASLRATLTASSPQLSPQRSTEAEGGNQSPSPVGINTTEAFDLLEQRSQASAQPDGAATTVDGDERGGGSLTIVYERGGSDSPSRQRGRPKVEICSAQDARTQRREMRSPPRGKRILEVASPRGMAPTEKAFPAKDFRRWNPPSLDSDAGGSQGVATDGGGNVGDVSSDGGQAMTASLAAEAERQKASIARYWATVEDRIANGSPNALGAGSKSRLFELPLVREMTKSLLIVSHYDLEYMITVLSPL